MRTRLGLTVALGLTMLGCAEKALEPSDASARFALSFEKMIGAQAAAAGFSADVYIGYARTSGARVALDTVHLDLAQGTRAVSIAVNVSRCLSDIDRPAPLASCTLLVDVVLRDANNLILDSVSVGQGIVTDGTGSNSSTIDLDQAATVTLDTCPGIHPTLYAVQDGTGPWTIVQPSAGKLRFRIKSSTSAFTFVEPLAGGGLRVMTFYGAKADRANTGFCPAPIPATGTVTGSINVGTPGEVTRVYVGNAVTSVGAGVLTYSLPSAPLGTRDVVTTRSTLTTAPGGQYLLPTQFRIDRNQNITSNAVLPVIPVNNGMAALPQAALTVNGAANGASVLTFSSVATRNTTTDLPNIFASPSTGVWFGIPDAMRLPTDTHIVEAAAVDTSGTVGTRTVSTLVQPITLNLLPNIRAPAVNVIATNPLRIGISQTGLDLYPGPYQLTVTQGSGPQMKQYLVSTSVAYRNGTSVAFTQPDLTQIPGWQSSWTMTGGTSTTIALVASTRDLADVLRFQNGATGSYAVRQITITP